MLLVSSPVLRAELGSKGEREGGREKARINIPRDMRGRSLRQGLEEAREGHYLETEESSAFQGI